MTDVAESKVVQTEVDHDTYERFKAAAEAEGLTIKSATQRAIEAFAARHQPIDGDDPLFEPLDWEAQDGDDDASERLDEILYGTETNR